MEELTCYYNQQEYCQSKRQKNVRETSPTGEGRGQKAESRRQRAESGNLGCFLRGMLFGVFDQGNEDGCQFLCLLQQRL